MLLQVGEQESSKSAVNARKGAFSALITDFRSTGPMTWKRRSVRSAGMDAILQSPARTAAVSGRKSGRTPEFKLRLAPLARRQQLEAPPVEAAVQTREELQRQRSQDLVGALDVARPRISTRGPPCSREYNTSSGCAFMAGSIDRRRNKI